MTTKKRWLAYLFIFFAVTIVALFFTFQAVHNYKKTSFLEAAPWQFGWWYLWMFLFPVIVRLGRRFPFDRQNWLRPVLQHILSAELITVLHGILLGSFLLAIQPLYPKWHMTFLEILKDNVSEMNLQLGMFTYTILLSISYMLDYLRRFQERTVESTRLQAQLAQTQFQTMKMQLHPQFLFSTLRSISTLMREDIDEADSLVARLGDFLRLTLEDMKQQQVTLERELLFLQCYLDIQKIRRQEALPVILEVEPQALDAQVPNMILQPLVEAAVDQPDAHRVKLMARRHNGSLVLQVQSPTTAEPTEEEMRFEIRTRLRLKQLYGDQYRFDVTNHAQNGRVLSLEIPYQRDPASLEEGVLV